MLNQFLHYFFKTELNQKAYFEYKKLALYNIEIEVLIMLWLILSMQKAKVMIILHYIWKCNDVSVFSFCAAIIALN